jgi:hypothetical protein
MKKILVIAILSSFVFAKQFFSLYDTLQIWSNYHKKFYNENITFILKDNINVANFATDKEINTIEQFDIETLKSYIIQKLNIPVIFKKETFGNNIVYYIIPQNRKTIKTTVDALINKLNEIEKKAQMLKNFNYKNFRKDIEKIKLKLVEYKNLEY